MEVQFKPLNTNHIPLILALQQTIKNGIKEPHLFVETAEAELQHIFKTKGFGIGGFYDNRFIATAVAYFPGFAEDNLGRDINLSEQDLLKVVHQEAMFVDPEVRGMGLQRQLFTQIEERTKALHPEIKFQMATVAPDNIASAKNLFRSGMIALKLKQKYNNFYRYILYKTLGQAPLYFEDHTIRIGLTAYDEQINLFENGYVGMGIEFDGVPLLKMGKLI